MMTDLEISQHAALDAVRELILSHGASDSKLYAALVLCYEQHKAFMRKVEDEARRALLTPELQGPGGVHHQD